MAQLDSSRRYAGSPKSASPATVDQLLQAGDPANLPAPASPSIRRDYEQEDDPNPPSKKSVLAKVKEKARKWKQTLVKKKQSNDENVTPAWGVNLDDEDEEEEDPEYLGAPMYESEMAPEGYKETARQHPRAAPVIPESHVLPSSANSDVNDEPKESDPPNNIPHNNTKTITETVTEKLVAPVAEATQSIASKIQGLTVTLATESSTTTASAGAENNVGGSSEQKQVFDKGVSVKEYLMNKLEPGEDERALSQVISAAISPKKAPGEMGVVEKVREAVTMLLGNGESTSRSTTTAARSPKSSTSSNSTICTKPSSISPVSTKSPTTNVSPSTNLASAQSPLIATNSASQIPVSTNAYEVNVVEENHGRILQTN